jgi:sulfite reductase (ferredoxin)
MTISNPMTAPISEEMSLYEEQIRKYRNFELGEVKMQKMRLQFGTYAQRQEGVQMQRIKLPGGFLTADQLTRLADASDRYASGFIHFTTRQAAQLYYVKLEETPTLLHYLSEEGITTREACGNTVRNVTTCCRSGTTDAEPFVVQNYAQALSLYLLRNKYNQTLGRKVKIAFEGCSEDHSGIRFHDMGFWATKRIVNGETRYGFRVFVGGGLGSSQQLGELYTDFLPTEDLLTFATAVIRIFDRYGERKKRMKARMKFLIKKLGWDQFVKRVEEELERLEPVPIDDYYSEVPDPIQDTELDVLYVHRNGTIHDPVYSKWLQESVTSHKVPGYKGVHVRLKLGDITSDNARKLAGIARHYSANQLRVSIEQNLYLPWVREVDLPGLHKRLKEISLSEGGTETIMDVTTCPGADTCRLGIASAKGLGSAISEAFEGPLAPWREIADSVRIKISGCPNGCAHHASAHIGFHAAALSRENRNIPAYILFLGGQANGEDTRFGNIIGKYPAKNCVKAIEKLLAFYKKEKQASEAFNDMIERVGKDRIKALLQHLKEAPPYELDPSFYKDYRHGNEVFSIRKGVKGECAGSPVGEARPDMEDAREKLAQAEASIYHKEYKHAVNEAYEAAASAVRLPLYQRLADPFTSEEALWKFENLFVLTGETNGQWEEISAQFDALKAKKPDKQTAQEIQQKAKNLIGYIEQIKPDD